jgi:hypothetical protein
VAVERSLGGVFVVQAVESESLLAQSSLRGLSTSPRGLWRVGNWPGEVTLEGITCQHAETSRERSDILSIKEVVAGSMLVRFTKSINQTHASMPPTSSTSSALPLVCMKYRAGVQYADLSCVTAQEVQLDSKRESSVELIPKSIDD